VPLVCHGPYALEPGELARHHPRSPTDANFPTFQTFVEQGSFAEANAMLSARTDDWAAMI
jgi:hypothetical protein